MCLAIPAKVISIREQLATVDILGNQTTADISILEDVKVGDYLLVHAGFAIQKYDPREGEENLQLVKELLSQTADEPIAGAQNE
jgi:hydrogenase expression/formation protein HypC